MKFRLRRPSRTVALSSVAVGIVLAGGGVADAVATSSPSPDVSKTVQVTAVPAIGSSTTDTGATGTAGFFFTGVNPAGTGDARSTADAFLANGQVVLQGTGLDTSITVPQQAPGIAKRYSVPLSALSGIGYQWQNDTATSSSATTISSGPSPAQAPTISISVTGATADGGTTNLVYTPAFNNTNVTATAQTCTSTIPTVTAGVFWEQDTFAAGNCWFSSADAASVTGGSGSPISIQQFIARNPAAAITQIALDDGAGVGTQGNFEAGADDLIIGLSGIITRYNFGG